MNVSNFVTYMTILGIGCTFAERFNRNLPRGVSVGLFWGSIQFAWNLMGIYWLGVMIYGLTINWRGPAYTILFLVFSAIIMGFTQLDLRRNEIILFLGLPLTIIGFIGTI